MKNKNISLHPTSQVFSSHSGLFLVNQFWDSMDLSKKIRKLLPKKKRNKGPTQVNKFKTLLYSFAVGGDCIADVDHHRKDLFFNKVTDGAAAARTIGDFLASIGKRHAEKIQDFLLEMTIELRLRFFQDKKLIISMDSTPHEQFAQKMEGVGYNYKNYWCLDSQNAYDQYGLSYLFDLRHGNTFSAVDSELWIHKIFSKIPNSLERWFRADSAYSKHVVFEALQIKKVNFAIVLKNNIGKYLRKKNLNTMKWTKTKIHFFGSDECEIASGVYPINKLGVLRVVFIRTRDEKEQLELLEDPLEQGYKHYAIITNVSSFDMKSEEVVKFYQERGNCENYIREQKNGFDFQHFPCKKLTANKTYGLIGTLAYNLTRVLSICMDQKVKRVRGKDKIVRTVTQLGYFAKTVRKKIINLPCQVVRSAHTVKLRLNRQDEEVLKKIFNKIKLNLSRVCNILQT